MDNDSILLDLKQAAAALSIKRSLLYSLLTRGELKAVKIGRRRLIARAEIEAYVASLQEAHAIGNARSVPPAITVAGPTRP